MGKATESVKVSKKVKSQLDELKIHEREPYSEVIERAVEALENHKTGER